MGCFVPDLADCEMACIHDCPSPLECRGGWCVSPGSSAVCPDVAGAGGRAGQAGAANEGAGSGGDADGISATELPGAELPGVVLPPLFCSEARILSSAALPMACAGQSYRAQVAAECATAPHERDTRWVAAPCRAGEVGGCLPSWLSLGDDGTLSGTAPADVGQFRFRLSAWVDTGPAAEADFELTVSDRCWVFSTDAEGQLEAHRIDGAVLQSNVVSLRDGERVADFDLAPDGRTVFATVSSSLGPSRAALVEVQPANVSEVAIGGETAPLLAHAFAPDSTRIALVSGTPEAAQLRVGRLGTAPLALGNSLAIDYVANLAWSAPSTVLWLGRSAQALSDDEPLQTAQEVEVTVEGLSARTTIQNNAGLPVQPYVQFFAIHPNAGGLFIQTNEALSYSDRCLGRAFQAYVTSPSGGALSPTLDAVATTTDGQLALRYYGSTPDGENCVVKTDPMSVACSDLLAWSADGSLLLCSIGGRLLGLRARPGAELDSVELDAGIQYASQRPRRRAISQTGRWIALDLEASASQAGGLVVLEPAAGATATQAVLPPVDGGWATNMAFSRDEHFLVVHRGPSLYVITLGGPGASVTDVSDALEAAPACGADALPDGAHWCGAPGLLPGPVRLSTEGNLVVFREASAAASVTEMAAPGSRLELGLSTQPCVDGGVCARFQ